MKPKGPRIVIKDDRDSSIGRGCVLYGAHFRPEVAAIPHAFAQAVRGIYHITVRLIVISEGYRDDPESLHGDCRAFDLSRHHYAVQGWWSWDIRQLREIAMLAEKLLGPDYDVVAHDAGSGWHVHGELHP